MPLKRNQNETSQNLRSCGEVNKFIPNMATGDSSSSRIHLLEHSAHTPFVKTDSTPWSFKSFKKSFKISITNIEDDGYRLEFDMIGIDASIVNAFRRILIAEVPTMAIDRVFLYNNTSVIQDEVLAHRLGLVPFKVDPRLFEYKEEGDEAGSPEDTLQFELNIKCTKNPNPPKDACTPDQLYVNHCVYTSDLKFVPQGDQLRMHGEIKAVDGDILLAKLRPGHEIDLKVHCVKGIGKDHTKFSPVATASYRLLPEIKLLKEVTGPLAHRLAHCFSDGVIEVVEENGVEMAKVANARRDTGSRNVFYDADVKDCVSMTKVKDHFLFCIESTGALKTHILFLEAVNILKEKCRHFLTELSSYTIEKKKTKK